MSSRYLSDITRDADFVRPIKGRLSRDTDRVVLRRALQGYPFGDSIEFVHLSLPGKPPRADRAIAVRFPVREEHCGITGLRLAKTKNSEG